MPLEVEVHTSTKAFTTKQGLVHPNYFCALVIDGSRVEIPYCSAGCAEHELIFGDGKGPKENSKISSQTKGEDLEKEEGEAKQDHELDPARKFNFKYDQSVCMSNKYPEVTIAPGEGQTPTGILSEKDWDIKSFPHLHNADGSNGKDQPRKVPLTDQYYFIQRVINKDTRFSQLWRM